MKIVQTTIILLLSSIFIFYVYAITKWYYNPSGLLGLNYNVKGKYSINDFNDKNYFFIVNHDKPCHTDIVILSNEVHTKVNDKKYVFFSGKCSVQGNYLYYKNKYEILQHLNNSVEKCTKVLESNKNLVFFLRRDQKGNGIYHILKNKKVPIVFVHKKLIKNPNNPELTHNYLLFNGMEYDIEYELVEDYNLEKNSEEFIKWVKHKLYPEDLKFI